MFRFGWLMFILEKSQLLPEFPDLESCFHLLLCTCNFLLAYTPDSFWTFGFRSLLIKYNLENDEDMTTLKKLAIVNNINGADEHERLQTLMISVEASIFELLSSKLQSQQSINKRSQPDQTGDNVLDPKKPLLEDCLEALDSKYAELLSSTGECDERIFIRQISIADTSSCQSSIPALNTIGAFLKFPISISGLFGDVIPISLNEWIAQFCIGASLQPSEELQSNIGGPDNDILTNINTSLYIQVKKLFPMDMEGSSSLSEEAVYGIKIFYIILDRLLQKDCAKLASLLTSKTFSQAVMICAFETVVFCLNLEHLMFPVLLNLLQLKAFDLSKLTDSFVRLFPEMPQKLKKHFEDIESQIIESLAWIAGSSLYPLISETSLHPPNDQSEEMDIDQPLFPTVSQPLPGLSLDHRSPSSAFKIVPSSKPEGKRATRRVMRSPIAAEVIPESLGLATEIHNVNSLTRVVLEDFFRKVLKLAATRLLDFKFTLDFNPLSSSLVMIMVYKTLKYALYEQTSLFYNRHLDQLVMSALYGVCKVNRLAINFKEIIGQYKTQTRHQMDIYKSVILQQSNPTFTVEKRNNVIEFYNDVFLPRMKVCLVKFSTCVNNMTDPKQILDLDEAPLTCEVVCPWLVTNIRTQEENTLQPLLPAVCLNQSLLEKQPMGGPSRLLPASAGSQ
eukprot:g3931.t1